MNEQQFDQAIQSILNGDKQGLQDIYQSYASYIYQVVLGIVKRKEDAEDIVGDFFIKLWQNADKYRPGSGHKGYLATIARNMALDFLRKHKREFLDSFSQNDEEDGITVQYASDENVEEQVISDMSLVQALDTLKPAERQIVDMKILSDMTFKEISETLNIPMGTVTWRYREAINKLRRCGYDEESC